MWYKTYRTITQKAACKIGATWRMYITRKKYREKLAKLYHESCMKIQRFTKGYMVFKKYKEVLHRKVIDKMMVHFRALKIKLHTNSKIIIWH
jgi:hypothetical protein